MTPVSTWPRISSVGSIGCTLTGGVRAGCAAGAETSRACVAALPSASIDHLPGIHFDSGNSRDKQVRSHVTWQCRIEAIGPVSTAHPHIVAADHKGNLAAGLYPDVLEFKH